MYVETHFGQCTGRKDGPSEEWNLQSIVLYNERKCDHSDPQSGVEKLAGGAGREATWLDRTEEFLEVPASMVSVSKLSPRGKRRVLQNRLACLDRSRHEIHMMGLQRRPKWCELRRHFAENWIMGDDWGKKTAGTVRELDDMRRKASRMLTVIPNLSAERWAAVNFKSKYFRSEQKFDSYPPCQAVWTRFLAHPRDDFSGDDEDLSGAQSPIHICLTGRIMGCGNHGLSIFIEDRSSTGVFRKQSRATKLTSKEQDIFFTNTLCMITSNRVVMKKAEANRTQEIGKTSPVE